MQSPIPRLVALAIRRPWVTLAIAALLTALALVVAVDRFAMTTDTAALISPDVDWRQRERAVEAAFPQLSDVMVVVIDGRTPELAEGAAASLAAKLAVDKAHFRRVSRPDGGDFFGREGLLFGSPAEVQHATAALIDAQPLLGPLAADPSARGVAAALSTILDGVANGSTTLAQINAPVRALTNAADRTLADRPVYFSWQRLFGGDATAAPTRRLLLLQPVLDHGALMPGEAATDALHRAATAMAIDPAHGVTIQLTGEVPLSDEEFATLEDNIGAVGAVMLVAMLATLWFATRSVRLVGAILATIVSGLVVTSAVGLLAVGRFNLISVAFIPLFVGLGVDFGIQFSVRFRAERLEHPTLREALSAAASGIGGSLALAATAIVLGFIAFLPTSYIGLSELGVIAALGMVIGLILNVTLLPALLAIAHPPRQRGEVGAAALAPVDAFLKRRRKEVLWAFALAMIGSIALLPFVRFDFNPLHLKNPRGEAVATLNDLARDPDETTNTIDVLAPDLPQADALAKRLDALPEVLHAITIQSFVPEDQAPKLAAIADAQTILDPTLNPFDVAPPPADAELVQSLNSTATALREAIAVAPRASGAGDASHLASALSRIAAGPPAARARATATRCCSMSWSTRWAASACRCSATMASRSPRSASPR